MYCSCVQLCKELSIYFQIVEMLTQAEIERITQYIRGMASENDQEWIEGLFSHGHGNQNLRHHLKSDWESTSCESDIEGSNLDHILDRIHHAIRKRES